MMGKRFKLREKILKILPEHRPAHFLVGLAARSHLKHKGQYPIDHECGQLVFYLLRTKDLIISEYDLMHLLYCLREF